MYLSRFLSIHALWVTVSSVMQPYPLVWGHYDVCKTQIYTEEGKVWDYMACQPESTDMTKYLKVKLDPPDITCGDPPETFCAMVSEATLRIEGFLVSGDLWCMTTNAVSQRLNPLRSWVCGWGPLGQYAHCIPLQASPIWDHQ